MLRNNTSEKKEDSNAFPLYELPMFALNQIIESMDVPERIELALTSERMRNSIRFARAKVPYSIHFKGNATYIEIEGEDIEIHCSRHEYVPVGFERRTMTLGQWINRNNPSLSVLDNTVNNFLRIQELAPSSRLTLQFHLDWMEMEATVKEFVDIPAFQNWDIIMLHGNSGREPISAVKEYGLNDRFQVNLDNDYIMIKYRYGRH
ncbi:hypothetical protein CRE_28835 [Caenorhabditis remanei]|uniref:F-box domain-containing protein n=1 Tax=Caenorhabditis remanei TaxID=31234 RepID=E3MXK2_CAERE|nr:hypothetical protein CRE_28835 [Caenorhabditis remanei]